MLTRPLTRPLSRSLSRPITGWGLATINIYVDSVNGLDTNDGLTADTAFQTLAAAQAATTEGDVIGFARGSYWREQYTVPANNVGFVTYGTGAMPVIDGADVVTTGWTQPDSVTYPNVWSRAWSRASATTTAQENLGYWENGSRTTYRTSLANLQAGSNGDWNTTSLTNKDSTVSIRAAADPNSDGILREITKRHYALNMHSTTAGGARSGCVTAGPMELKRCVGHYNAFSGNESGKKLLLRDGNIHHTVIEGQLLEDVIAFEVDTNTTAAAPITHYRAVGTGFNPVSRRCLILFPGGDARASTLHGAFTAHASSPAVSDSHTIQQSIVIGAQIGGGGAINTTSDTYCEDWNGPSIDTGSSVRTLRRLLFRDTKATPYVNGSNCFRRLSSTGTYNAINCCVQNRKGISLVGSSGGTQPTLTNCSTFTNQGDLISAGAPTVNYSVIWAVNGRAMQNVVLGYSGDYNVFYSGNEASGPIIHWNGTLYNGAFGTYQAASGQDANSVFCKAADQVSGNGIAFWLGVATGANAGPQDGDWRINPNAKVYKGDGSALTGLFGDGVTPITQAGGQEHWNFNTRSIVAGPPTRYPVPPLTIADMRTYVEDPTAWNFYP